METAALNRVVPVENTGLPPLLSPGCDLPPPHSPPPTHLRTSSPSQVLENLQEVCLSPPAPRRPLASRRAFLTSAPSALLTLYQQPCVGAVLAGLAAVTALVLRSHVIDDQAVGVAMTAQLVLVSRAQRDPLPQPAHLAPRAGHSHLQHRPAANQNCLLARGAAAYLERQCWGWRTRA